MKLAKKNKKVFCFNSLGTQGYFSAMSFCLFLLGNSSSGIIEAASFGKYVVNIGGRQKGRERSSNVIDCQIVEKKILEAIKNTTKIRLAFSGANVYGDRRSTNRVIKHLLNL